MAESSKPLPLGSTLPEFALPDTLSKRTVGSRDLLGKPSVVAFICNHCPYVKHIRTGLAAFGRYAADKGVALVAISSNDVSTHPQDGPDAMAEEARSAGYVFPYLYDESQAVASAFHAACTPEFYLFDAEGRLGYHGQFDGSRPNNGVPVTGEDLKQAVEALLSGKAPASDQKLAIGCSIKWKRGA